MKNQSVISKPPDKLILPRQLRQQIVEHCRQMAPLEACGLLSGKPDRVKTVHRMTNTDSSREHYTIDPREQFELFKNLRGTEDLVLAIYHSHPHSEAYPSEEDKKLAFYPTVVYLIVSLEKQQPEFRGFIIDQEKTVREIPIKFLNTD